MNNATVCTVQTDPRYTPLHRRDLPAGTLVPHMPGCACEDTTERAVMWDERTVLGGMLQMCAADLVFVKLRAAGISPLRWSRSRQNAAGDPIDPECAIRSCEVEVVWKVMRALREATDSTVAQISEGV